MNALIVVASLVLTPAPQNLVEPLTFSSQILVPVAGNVEGVNGTHFRSDLTIVNFRDVSQNVRVEWLPQTGGERPAPVVLTLAASSGLQTQDFVAQTFGIAGLGSVVFTGITAGGTFDSTALLYVTSRIWTPQPGTTGTTSQSLPTIPTSSARTPNTAFLLGLQRTDQYRLNVGIVNVDPTHEQTFEITEYVPDVDPSFKYTVSVPPMSMQQIPMTPRNVNASFYIDNVTDAVTRSDRWISYGASVDNVTGDSWSELAVN
jgi:hypothetical protein